MLECETLYESYIKNLVQQGSFKGVNHGRENLNLTEDVLKTITEDNLEYALIEYIIEKKIGDNYKQKYEIVTQLPKGLKYHYVSWLLEAEVFNGGFNQYFYNTSGIFINEAIDAYNYFGLHEISSIVEKAAKIAVQEIDLHIKTRKSGTLEAFSNSYNFTNLEKQMTSSMKRAVLLVKLG